MVTCDMCLGVGGWGGGELLEKSYQRFSCPSGAGCVMLKPPVEEKSHQDRVGSCSSNGKLAPHVWAAPTQTAGDEKPGCGDGTTATSASELVLSKGDNGPPLPRVVRVQ